MATGASNTVTERQAEVADANKKRHIEKKKAGKVSSNHLAYIACTRGGTPIVEGSVGLCSNGNVSIINCRGYLVSILPEDTSRVVIVLDLPEEAEGGGRMIPCLCPAHLIEDAAIKASNKGKLDNRKKSFCRSMKNVQISSIPVRRGDVLGHLMLSGPKNFLGRVVDNTMLAALEAGCLRVGEHSTQAVYNLNRLFTVQRNKLKDTCHILVESSDGIRLCPAGRLDSEIVSNWGELAIESRLVYQRSIKLAIIALDQASSLPPPSIDERVFQVAIGGDQNSMTVGKFLPCQRLSANPNVEIRCACGFDAVGVATDNVKTLLRRRCNRKSPVHSNPTSNNTAMESSKGKDISDASDPSSSAISPQRNNEFAIPSTSTSPLPDDDNEGGEECPKCTVCKKRLGRRNCIKQACVKCCNDPTCEPHLDARETLEKNQSILDGTDWITRTAAQKRASKVAPGMFFDTDIHYFGDTVAIWNVKEFMKNPKWREDAIRRSRNTSRRRDSDVVGARNIGKRKREEDNEGEKGEGKSNDGVVDEKKEEDDRGKKKKPLSRKKRFKAICDALYQKNLSEK